MLALLTRARRGRHNGERCADPLRSGARRATRAAALAAMGSARRAQPGMRPLCLALLCLAAVPAALGFYLPGVAPQDFARDDLVYFKARPAG
jgi:hypothetical protein